MTWRRGSGLWLCGGLVAVAAGGCGADGGDPPDRAARPSAAVQLSADISADGVRISPSRVGAGQVRIVVTNDTDRPLRPVLSPAGRSSGAARTDEVMAPGSVSAIVATVRPGTWRLRAGSARGSAKLRVGRARPSSDDVLLLP